MAADKNNLVDRVRPSGPHRQVAFLQGSRVRLIKSSTSFFKIGAGDCLHQMLRAVLIGGNEWEV